MVTETKMVEHTNTEQSLKVIKKDEFLDANGVLNLT